VGTRLAHCPAVMRSDELHSSPRPPPAPGPPPRRDPELAAAFEQLLSHARHRGRHLDLREFVELAEAWRIEQALRETRGNRSAAARLLGIGRRTLYAKMAKLGL